MKTKIWLKGFIYSFIVIQLLLLSSCQKTYPPAKDITLLPLFTDNMVLQQKQEIPIWGKAEPGGEVVVTFNKQEKKGIVDDEGNWKVSFSPVPAGGPYELVISGEKTNRMGNIMVGEVWVCSGQSNMEMPLAGWGIINNYKEEIANANYPNIRLLMVEKKSANTPQESFNSDGWKECSSESIPEFSAVAYFFGRYLHGELNIPIGLIETAWGGTVAEAWTSGPALKKFPEFKDIVDKIAADKSTGEERAIATKNMIAAWPDKIEEALVNSGIFNHGFQKTDYNTDKWKTMKLPTTWEETGLEYDGVVWFSKEVEVPKSWEGKDLVLTLGKINDYDITWFNGKRVGRGTDVADFRVYKIAGSLVKAGGNKITVQVLDIGNHGGLYGPANKMKLSTKDKSISLVGNWKYKVDPIKIDINKLPLRPSLSFFPNRPSVLYNGMINPLLPYGIRGAIWYQGESNAGRALQYRSLFKSLINDWRKAWGQGDFSFLFVQLANFMKRVDKPVDEPWSHLREAQTMALQLPNTGMAVTVDIGNAIDIHPKNKQDVGKRLALNAIAKVYGKDIPYSGPMYKSMKIVQGTPNGEGDKIVLQFDNTNQGLKTKGNKKLKGFAIAGKDKKFVWAKAKIDGDQVVVSNSKIKDPVAVRYGWAPNPDCNLYNGAELPASPFRTDTWKGITYARK